MAHNDQPPYRPQDAYEVSEMIRGLTSHLKGKDGESTVKAGLVMFGTGRHPNSKGIGLEASL